MSPAHHHHTQLRNAGNVPKLAGGRAGNDDVHDSLPESSLALSRRKRECDDEEEESFGIGQPLLSAVGSGFVEGAKGEGGGWHRTYRRDIFAGVSVLPSGVPACYCPPRWCGSPSSRAKTEESNRRCRRPHTLPGAGNPNVSHANRRRPCNECTRRCCTNVDAWEYRRRDSSRGGHDSEAAAATAAPGVKVAAAAASSPDRVGVGEGFRGGHDLDVGVGPLSLAAVEAWEAAETWALAVAAATGAVAAGGSSVSAETAESSAGKKEPATVDPDRHCRRSCGAAEAEERVEGGGCSSCCCCAFAGGPAWIPDIRQSALHRRDSVLVCGSSTSTSTTPGLCHSAVHRRDSVLYSSSSPRVPMGAALKSAGRVPGVAATRGSSSSSSSTCPRHPPTRTSAGSDERPIHAPGRSKAASALDAVPATVRPVVVVAGAAAAIVLGRIDRGDRLWGRRARRAGLAALKDHRTRAARQKMRGATAARFYETALKARGLRALEALTSRKKGRGEAAVAAAAAAVAAAATADAFARAQRMRGAVAMLNRNLQARMALRSRDDLADLHFAEWRIPCAVRVWRGRTRALRSCRYSNALATSKWRSRSLPVALARWVRHSLGNAEKRRRLLVWREALSTQTSLPPPARPGPDSDSTPSGRDGNHDGRRGGETNERQLSQQGRATESAVAGAALMVQHATPPLAPSSQPPSGPESLLQVSSSLTRVSTATKGVSVGGARSSPTGEHRPQGANGLEATAVVAGSEASTDSSEGSEEENTPGRAGIALNIQGGEPDPENDSSPGRGELARSAGDTLAIGRSYPEERTAASVALVPVCARDTHQAGGLETEGEQNIVLAGDAGSLGGAERGGSRDGNQGRCSTERTSSILPTSIGGASGCGAKDSGEGGNATRQDVADGSSGDPERVARGSTTTIESGTKTTPESSSSSSSSSSSNSSSSSSGGWDSKGSEERNVEDGDDVEPGHSASEDTDEASSSPDAVHLGNVSESTGARTSSEVSEETTVRMTRTASARGDGGLAKMRSRVALDTSEEEEEEEKEATEPDARGLDSRDQKIDERSEFSSLDSCDSAAVLDRTSRSAVDGGEAAAARGSERRGVGQPSPVQARCAPGIEATPSAGSSSSSSPVSAPRHDVGGASAATGEQQQQQIPPRVAITVASPVTAVGGHRDAPRRLRGTGGGLCVRTDADAGDLSETGELPQNGGSGDDLESRQDSTREGRTFGAGAARGVGDNNGDGDESSPLSWVSASRADEIRSNEGRNLARTLSGGWLVSTGNLAGIVSSFRGARNDDGPAGGSSTPGVSPQDLGDPHSAEGTASAPGLRATSSRPVEEDFPSRTTETEGTVPQCATDRNKESEAINTNAPRDLAPPRPSQVISPERVESANSGSVLAGAESLGTAGSSSEPAPTEERQSSTLSPQPPTSRTPASGSAAIEPATEKTAGLVQVRPASGSAPASASAPAPRERQASPSVRRQSQSPLLSLSELGLGSVPVVHSVQEEPAPAARRTRAAEVPGATGSQHLQPRNLGNVGPALSARGGERGGTLYARAGVVLTFPAPGQAASSELSCISWSDRGGVGSDGHSRDSARNRSSRSGRGSINTSKRSSVCSSAGSDERRSAGGGIEATNGSSLCSSIGSRRTRCGGSGVEASAGVVFPTAERGGTAHASPGDDANSIRAWLDAPAVDGLKPPPRCRSASSSSSSPSSSPTRSTRVAGSEGRTSRTPESNNDSAVDRCGSHGCSGGSRSGSGGGNSSSRSKSSSTRRPARSSGRRGNSSSQRQPTSSGGDGNNSQKTLERMVLKHVPMPRPGSQSSGSRRRETLEERVSEAFLRRRLLEAGLRRWQRWTATSTSWRRSTHSLAAGALAFVKRVALARWRAAHVHLRILKAAEVARRSRLLPRVGRSASRTGGSAMEVENTAAVAVAIVMVRRWHRRSVAKLLLRRTFDAWSARAQRSRDVAVHRSRALTRRGLARWRRVAQGAGRARGRSAAVAFFMSRAVGRRRLRAWLQRRRRRIDALRAADDHRALAGLSPAAARWRRQRRRDERLRAEAALSAWRTGARERAASRSARRAAVAGAEGRLRGRAIEAWKGWAAQRRRRRCLLTDVTAVRARRLGGEGLRGLEDGALGTRARQESLRVADEHWRRRGATVFTALRNLVGSRRRLFRRARALRLRIAARAGLHRWRRVAHNTRVARDARIKGDSWRRRKATRAGVSALSDSSDRRVAQSRAMCAGRLHFSRALASRAAASWRVWTRRQAAAAELYDAATALHRSWIASAGLRALDRVARARTARREAAHTADRHLLRTRGLVRWRSAAAERAHARGQAGIATVHWATTLSSKVLVSWGAAAMQQWAESRQEEAATQHARVARKKRGLRAWTAAVFGHPGNGRPEQDPRLVHSKHRHGLSPDKPVRFWSREAAGACCRGRSQPSSCVPLLKPDGRLNAASQHHRCRGFPRANPPPY